MDGYWVKNLRNRWSVLFCTTEEEVFLHIYIIKISNLRYSHYYVPI